MPLNPVFSALAFALCTAQASWESKENVDCFDEPALVLLQTSMMHSRSLAKHLHDIADKMAADSRPEAHMLKELDPAVASLLEESETSTQHQHKLPKEDKISSTDFTHTKVAKDEPHSDGKQVKGLHSDFHNHELSGQRVKLGSVLNQVKDLLRRCKALSERHGMQHSILVENPECSTATMLALYQKVSKLSNTPPATATATSNKPTIPPQDGPSDFQFAQTVLNDTEQNVMARVQALANAVDEYKELAQMRQQMSTLGSEVAPEWTGKWWEEQVDAGQRGNRTYMESKLSLIVQRLEQLQRGARADASVQEQLQQRAKQDLMQFKLVHSKMQDELNWPLITASKASTPSTGLWLWEANTWQARWESLRSSLLSLVAFVVVLGVLLFASCCGALKMPKPRPKFIYG